MEAHVDLAKIACRDYATRSCWNILIYVYSVPCLSRRYRCQNRKT
jgi:hypothetical protein